MNISGPRPMRRLMAAVAAVGLLAAGCDYWGNLVDEKKVTRVRVAISVVDAWTGYSLVAHCKDTAHGLDILTDEAGQVKLTTAQTGPYSISCESDGYYPVLKNAQVGITGDSMTVEMARMGKEHWYPGDPTKQVAFTQDALLHRFPGTLSLMAYPLDPDGRFRYEWRFARNVRFNRTFQHPVSAQNFLWATADTGTVVPGEDTVIVTVASRLAGREFYEVGSDTLHVNWVRNKRPHFDTVYLTSAQKTFRVDCAGAADIPRLVVTASDQDEDGVCDSLVLYTRDSSSGLANIPVTRACGDRSIFRMQLKNPFGKPQPGDPERVLPNILHISAYDNNKERIDTSISFNSRFNALPVVKIARVGPEINFLTNQTVRMKFDINDNEDGGALQALIVNWEAGVEDTLLPPETSNAWSQIAEHAYATPGLKYPSARAVDFCGDTAISNQQVGVTIKASP